MVAARSKWILDTVDLDIILILRAIFGGLLSPKKITYNLKTTGHEIDAILCRNSFSKSNRNEHI